MNLVADHEAVEGYLLSFQTFLTDCSFADLAAQDLCADIVLAGQHQLHLVEDEIDLFFVL